MDQIFSFRRLLIASFTVMLVIFFVVPCWYAYRNLTNVIDANQKTSLFQRLQLINNLMTQQEAWQNVDQLQEWLVRAAIRMELRITYVAEDGIVLADSYVPSDKIKDLENYLGRPEIIQALNEGIGFARRFSRVMQREEVFAAARMPQNGAVPAGVLRVGEVISPMLDVLKYWVRVFILLFVAFWVFGFSISNYLGKLLRRSVDALSRATTQIADHSYSNRIRFNFGQEFYELGEAINRMAEVLRKEAQLLRAQKQQLEAVFNGMKDGVMVLDRNCRIKSVNCAMVELLPKDINPVGRRPLEVIVNLELQTVCERLISSSDKNLPAVNMEITLEEERNFEASVIPLMEHPKELGAIVVFHDLTELKRLEKVRQDFVANVSHELRTPLTSVKGYAETLLGEARTDPAMLESFLEIILKNTNQMVKMVDDLLQLARIEARQDPLKLTSVNPYDALLAAWKACFPIAEGRKVELINHIPIEELYVFADYDQLVQVFRNLLENGIRYSPEGSTLEVRCYTEGDEVTFSVVDEGPGIPRQHQQRIFERFYRVEKHRSAQAGGTGLGLAICRHIILNHGGRIWVQSPNPGKKNGATFSFTLLREKTRSGTLRPE